MTTPTRHANREAQGATREAGSSPYPTPRPASPASPAQNSRREPREAAPTPHLEAGQRPFPTALSASLPGPRQPSGTEQPRVLLTVEQAAERLAISRSQMFVYLKQGLIQSVKLGRLRRIPDDAIDAFIARLAAEQNGA